MILKGDISKSYGPFFIVFVALFFFAESFLHYHTIVAYALVISWVIVAGLGYSAKHGGYKGKLYFGTYTLIFYVITGLWRTVIVRYDASLGFGFLTHVAFNIVLYIPFIFIGYSLINNIKAIRVTPQFESRINSLLTNIDLNNPSPGQDPDRGHDEI